MLSEKMKRDFEKVKNGYMGWFLSEKIKQYLPEIKQLEQQRKELINALIEDCKLECLRCDYNRKKNYNICDYSCRIEENIKLLEKIINKKWKHIRII